MAALDAVRAGGRSLDLRLARVSGAALLAGLRAAGAVSEPEAAALGRPDSAGWARRLRALAAAKGERTSRALLSVLRELEGPPRPGPCDFYDPQRDSAPAHRSDCPCCWPRPREEEEGAKNREEGPEEEEGAKNREEGPEEEEGAKNREEGPEEEEEGAKNEEEGPEEEEEEEEEEEGEPKNEEEGPEDDEGGGDEGPEDDEDEGPEDDEGGGDEGPEDEDEGPEDEDGGDEGPNEDDEGGGGDED